MELGHRQVRFGSGRDFQVVQAVEDCFQQADTCATFMVPSSGYVNILVDMNILGRAWAKFCRFPERKLGSGHGIVSVVFGQ